MAIEINGSGTISGISSGGINDDVVDAGTIAANSRMVLEQFYSPCDGSVIALQDGNHTLTQPSAYALTDSWTDVVGSSITYTPPTGTTQVIYEYDVFLSDEGGNGPICNFALYLDSDEVTHFRRVLRENDSTESIYKLKWGFNIGGTASTASGRVASWTSGKTIKLQTARYSSSYDGRLHESNHWGPGGSSDILVMPCVGITAIG